MTTPTELTAAPTIPLRRSDRKWGIVRLVSPLAVLGLWQLGWALGVIPQDVLPVPSLILEAGVELIETGKWPTPCRCLAFGWSRDSCWAEF